MAFPTEAEKLRADDLFRLLPTGMRSVLEIGSRRGLHTRRLTECFESVTALDLQRPAFAFERVTCVQGDVTALDFPDDGFDCVLCAEVLEHVRDFRRAGREIARVARCEILLGVPYRQDLRSGRTRCASCGRRNPPYGHINSFDDEAVRALFPRFETLETSYVGNSRSRTTALTSWLMDLAGNPYGAYDQEEPCIYCASRLKPTRPASLPRRICSAVAVRMDLLQARLSRPRPAWIHVRLRKT